MSAHWLDLVARLLRPARPRLTVCLRERERFLDARRLASETRQRALASCEAEIERVRAGVFAANDGIVPGRMRELEGEWRRLARLDPDGALMDLWARIAPPAWIDEKRWRASAPAAQLDVAVGLAADVLGVEAAEAAVAALRATLRPWGISLGPKIRWRASERDTDPVPSLLGAPLRAAGVGLAGSVVVRAQEAERLVRAAAMAACPDRPALARGVGYAAFVDALWRTSQRGARPDPVTPLRDVWRAGYALASADASGVTLEVPLL